MNNNLIVLDLRMLEAIIKDIIFLMKTLLMHLIRNFLWESWQCLHEVAFHFFFCC